MGDAEDAAESVPDPADFAYQPVLLGFGSALGARTDLKARTRQTYLERVRQYLRWVSGQEGYPDALTSPQGCDRAVTDYIAAAVERGAAGSTINVTRWALEAFYTWLGLPPPALAHADVGPIAPRTLDDRELRSLLREAAAAGPRAYALIVLALDDNGPRETELTNLDVSDLDLNEFPGRVSVTDPSGQIRTQQLQPGTRVALVAWLAQRASLLGDRTADTTALFTTLSPPYTRIAPRTVDDIVRSVGREAGVEVSPGMLRATAEQRQLRAGVPPVEVADRLGQRKSNPARVRALLADSSRGRRNRLALSRTEQLTLFGDAGDDAPI